MGYVVDCPGVIVNLWVSQPNSNIDIKIRAYLLLFSLALPVYIDSDVFKHLRSRSCYYLGYRVLLEWTTFYF